MKFPKSLHAEGWSQHLDKKTSGAPALGPTARPATPRPSARHEPLHREPPLGTPLHASPSVAASGFTAPPAAPRRDAVDRRSGMSPWLVGAGIGVVAIGLGIAALSRNPSAVDTSAPPAAVLSQADTSVPSQPQPSPEDALLNAEPPAAGAVAAGAAPDAADATADNTPAPVTAPPVAEPAPRRDAPRAVAAAQPSYDPPAVVRATPEPVVRERLPEPQTLAQAAPPAVIAPQEPLPATPVTPVTPAPAVTPPEQLALTPTVVPPVEAPAQPAEPPVVAQAEPQPLPQPAATNPEDAGITQQVRVALSSDATLVGLPIAVSTQQGVVKLEGQAPDAPTRERATVVASATSGVKAVDNRLTVVPPTVVSQAPMVQTR